MKKFSIYKQFDSMDCGPTCLKMVAANYGKSYTIKYLRERCSITREGVSLLGISNAAEIIGFHTLGVRLSFNQLIEEVPLPCIAHWKGNHFIVIYNITYRRKFLRLKKTNDIYFHIADPARGIIKYNSEEFQKGWLSNIKNSSPKGHCLILEPTPDFYEHEIEKINKKSISYLIKHLISYKNLVIQLLLSFIVGSFLSMLLPFLTQSIVDKGISYKDISFLTLILLSQLMLVLGQAFVGFIRGWILLHLTARINISLISNFLMKLMRLPISFFDSKMTGDLMQRMSDNSRIQNFLTSTSLNFLFSAANFFIFGFVMIYYNLNIFLIYLLGSLIYIGWITIFLKFRKELDNRRFSHMAQNQSNVIQLITGMQEIKLNNCEKQKRWEWERIQAMLFKISIKGLILGQYQQGGAVIINGAKNLIITFLTAKEVIDGQMTLGMMLAVQYIIGQLNSPIEQLIGFLQSWQDTKLSIERLSEIEEKDAEDDPKKFNLNEIPQNKDISIKSVSFQYEGPNSQFVLENINLNIPSNKITAIVGTSGSGKTTLLKLLLGFYKPTQGEILIGNSKLETINCHTWRKCVGAVMQEGFIFSDTIANNISISDEEINYEKLNNSVEIANIKSFIESLALGYNTKIGGEGHGLSQGQKQRILIARAVYKNPEFILFDEATNSLDADNERTIMQNFISFFQGKTVVIVAHRLSTVKGADNIVVLEKGKIVEQGPHQDLIRKKGIYFNLVKNQLELDN